MTTEHGNDPPSPAASPPEAGVTGRLIRITTALAVASVAAVAAVISCRHACELVTTHGETGLTARLLPFTVDGLILAASMPIPDASPRHHPWHAGAWSPASPPPSAPTSPTASATDPSARWSAPGPPWPWPDPSNSS